MRHRALHEESEDSGFIYYCRYFRVGGRDEPQPFAPLLAPMGTFSILTLPADNGTWAVTLSPPAGDQPLKRMRDPDRGGPSSRPARCMRTGSMASRSAT